MRRKFIVLPGLLFIVKISLCQSPVKQTEGGGSYQDIIKIKDELTPGQRTAIVNMLQENESRLRREGKLNPPLRTAGTAFEWPLKQALGFNDNGYYGISNYVDENPAFPNALLDYSCGNRTYDQSNGYNHAGTDIFTWPFYWQKMARNAVEIIAGAPGTIIGKSDGNYDQNCAFCVGACTWNAVYIMQNDGSVAWYGHMKSGSLTTKAVGQTVVTGEYLGVVGSSGNSTGPHLHFEVYTNSQYTQLVDPWAGPCNNLNLNPSWWANQQPYFVSTINKIMTHSAPPNMTQCPAGDAPNEKINFADGQTIFVGTYYRDQQIGQQVFHAIYKPDGTPFDSWTQTFVTYFSASWWWYSRVLPNPAPPGNWRCEATYNGKKLTTWFAVNSTAVTICPNSINPIFSNLVGNSYQWQVNTGDGNGFLNISDNNSYSGTATNQLQLKNIPSSFYGYQYRCVVNGANLSHVISLKFVSYWTGSKGTSWDDPFNWSCGYVPDANTDVIIQNGFTNYPEINSNTSCRGVTVNSGASLKVNPGVNLTVTH